MGQYCKQKKKKKKLSSLVIPKAEDSTVQLKSVYNLSTIFKFQKLLFVKEQSLNYRSTVLVSALCIVNFLLKLFFFLP